MLKFILLIFLLTACASGSSNFEPPRLVNEPTPSPSPVPIPVTAINPPLFELQPINDKPIAEDKDTNTVSLILILCAVVIVVALLMSLANDLLKIFLYFLYIPLTFLQYILIIANYSPLAFYIIIFTLGVIFYSVVGLLNGKNKNLPIQDN